ncbi:MULTISPECIES: ABC transporter ATP-binding protein [Legionella]|uniref:ABC transporter ATP-binding protein n=1 Tax=Legionella drozanskii LLAP-1 TaxID=1212489 RepID=A0A0W0TC44_9GAMM|nr:MULTISPECIES: ABC transporter ATP-binding protein [Legionella]KTC93175.1 ABC transporter ATP-binding protein [Legionella drozanskii LLAP-1]PJE14175.1 MAG: ABC transporter ATP-binding protein [Legionella sp.]
MTILTLSQIYLSLVKKQKIGFFLLIATSLFGALQQCIMPWGIRYIVNTMSTAKYNHISISRTIGFFLIVFVISEMIIRSQGVFIAIVMPKFKANIKSYFINNMLMMNYGYFLENMPGVLTQKVNDIVSSSERIAQIIIYNFFTIIMSLLLIIGFMYYIQPFYSFLIMTWFTFHVLTTWLRLKKSLPLVQVHNKVHSSICGNLSELISRITSVKTYLGKDYELKRIDKELHKEKLSLKGAQLFFEKAKVIQSIFSLFFIIILIVHQIYGFNNGKYSIGDFIFVVFVSFNLITYVWFSSFQLTIFSREIATIKDAYAVLTKGDADLYDLKNSNMLGIPNNPDIKIKNLSFMFSSGNKVINDLSLEISFNDKILLYGKSGTGKSTLAKILVGLYSGFSGEITVGNKPLSDFSRNELNRLVILVEQQTILFNRTIRENICYSNVNYNLEELEHALNISCCNEFITKLEHGLDTKLGEKGISLSGGQIQRIAIARAVLFNPKILILDESTSGLENELEKQVISNLVALKNMTLIIISHSVDLLSIIPKKFNMLINTEQVSINYGNKGVIECLS